MFPEYPIHTGKHRGWIEVISGSMFSGKTVELIRRIRRAQIAKQKFEIYKPVIDNRYAEEKVVSHDANEMDSVAVASSTDILKLIKDPEVVGIDEAQFFDLDLVNVCTELANKGIRVVVAGLDKDYQGKPFGPMPALMASAEYVTKIHAVCMRCGSLANFSHRITSDDSLIVLGEKNNYEPLCRECFNSQSKK
ncbi:MAG: thymidine kinase [Bacteroidetes bacterium]|nr:thymidine kinase [Bacteroidota bacterium]